jgi:hypothetical protein
MDQARQELGKKIGRLLFSPSPEIIAIKGPWGIGKTFAVKRAIEKTELSGNICSYVSLFGVTGISDIPSVVLNNAYYVGDNNRDLRKISASFIRAIRKLPQIEKYDKFIKSFEPSAIGKIVVIFDDLERIQSKKALCSLLGYITSLREDFQCKIVLVYNEDKIVDDQKVVMNEFLEKVVDEEYLFDPTVEDNLKIFFSDASIIEAISKNFKILDCNNLRIMRKTRNIFETMDPILKTCRASVFETFVNQLSLVCIFLFHYANKVSIEELNHGNIGATLRRTHGKESEADKLFKASEYYPREFDTYFVKAIKTGKIDSDKIEEIVKIYNERDDSDKIDDKLRKCFKVYNGNFHGTKEGLKTALETFLSENWNLIRIPEYNQILEGTRSIGIEDVASPYLERFVSENFTTWDQGLIQHVLGMLKDGPLRASLQTYVEQKQDKRTIYDVIKSVVVTRGWDPEDEAFLDEQTDEDYVKWLREEESEKLLSHLREFLRLFRSNRTEGSFRGAIEKLIKAIFTIKDDNDLNKVRIEKFLELENGEGQNPPTGSEEPAELSHNTRQ